MEKLVVKLVSFFQVLLLHAVAHSAMFAIGRLWGNRRSMNISSYRRAASCLLTGLWKQQLIYDDIVRVDFVRSEFLYKPFRLVQ
jgi:hypothetical protein